MHGERFGLASLPELDGQSRLRVDQQGSIAVAAAHREVVHGQHRRGRSRRIGKLHQTVEQSGPAEHVVQVEQQPGSGFPRHHDRLQGGRTPLVAHRQPDDLLGESGLRAGRFSQYSRRTDRSIRTGRPPTASSAICRV